MARSDVEKAQSMLTTLEAQRNQAFNQVAQMQVLLDDNAAEIADKDKKLEECYATIDALKPKPRKAAK